MSDKLDLYAGPPIRWKQILVVGLLCLLSVALGMYRWMTMSTPVSQDTALEIFEKEQVEQPPSEGAGNRSEPKKGAQKKKKTGERGSADNGGDGTGGGSGSVVAGASEKAGNGHRQRSEQRRLIPEEGVYSWRTDGYERAGGARREMPKESQGIVTHQGSGWMTHHYFSEEKEYWTGFRVEGTAVFVEKQRNKVTFGPVTNDGTVDFAPPMLVGPAELHVGQTWDGTWEGKTSGRYRGETFERTTIDVGGTPVKAWGIRVEMQLRGEISGEVISEVWYAPKHALTVKEHWVQDVEAGVSYQAEWTMTLKSLVPAT